MKNSLLILVTLVLYFPITNAQSSSVYSRYGIGDLEFGYSAKMIAIGNFGVAQLDPDHLSVSNPARLEML